MTLDISQFSQEDSLEIKITFANQLQKHFTLLTQAVPRIKEIEWTSQQIDENAYEIAGFVLLKENGYNYRFDSSWDDREKVSETEFNPEETVLINQFIDYIEKITHMLVAIFGSDRFTLNKE